MVELHKEEKIKKGNDRYIHTTIVTYPNINVRNMLKSWQETLQQEEEWLGKYQEYIDEAKKMAEQSVEVSLIQGDEEITKILAMSDEERFKYWNEKFLENVEQHNELKKKKEELIESQFKQNKELLDKYKAQYEQDAKVKREAIKKWTI